MSQQHFMINLRMTMPQYVTNVTSFNDAVKILKNKAILTEAALGENNLLDELESEMENGNSYAESIAKVAAKYNINEDELATKYPEEAVGNKAYADNYTEPVDDSDVDWTNEDKDEDDEIEAMVKKMEAEKEGEEAIMSQYDPMEESLQEGKGKDLHPNQIHPQELRMGIKVELEHTDDLDKAKKIALDHLAENPFYYTALKLSGIESPSAPKAKAPAEKKAKKKETVELVDKENQMKPVSKKKLKEARLNIDGEPNTVVKQAMAYVDSNPMLKIISDDIEFQQSSNPNEAILRYGYWEELPDEAIAKLKLQFNVEEDLDYDTNTGDMFMYLLTPKAKTDSADLGASFEKFKSQLEEMIREAVNEMQSDDQEIEDIAMSMDEYFFDGRDNLIDPLAAEEK